MSRIWARSARAPPIPGVVLAPLPHAFHMGGAAEVIAVFRFVEPGGFCRTPEKVYFSHTPPKWC